MKGRRRIKINIGVIGCSSIALKAVLPAIRNSNLFQLVAVGSRDPLKASFYASRFQCGATTYEGIIRDQRIDAVYVSLPVALHYHWGMKVMKSGKHLLLEKTFTESYLQGKRLFKLAQSKSLVAMEGLMYIYHPLFGKVKELIQKGIAGDIRLIEARFGFPYPEAEDIRNSTELGGGALLDSCIYPLSLSLYISGSKPIGYSAKIFAHEHAHVDGRGFIQLEWGKHCAQIAFGFGFTYRNSYAIWGDKAVITVERGFSRPSNYAGKITITDMKRTYNVQVKPSDHFKLMLESFAKKIKGIPRDGFNEEEDVLLRLRYITDIRSKYLNAE